MLVEEWHAVRNPTVEGGVKSLSRIHEFVIAMVSIILLNQ